MEMINYEHSVWGNRLELGIDKSLEQYKYVLGPGTDLEPEYSNILEYHGTILLYDPTNNIAKLATLSISGGDGYATADICEVNLDDMIEIPAIRILERPERVVDFVISLLGWD